MTAPAEPRALLPVRANDDELPAAPRSFDPRYERGTRLGAGGMGEVHAFHDRVTGRDVAMKTLRDERRGRNSQQRLVREARAQAQLEPPSFVPVYDVGRTEEGMPTTLRYAGWPRLGHLTIERLALQAWTLGRLVPRDAQPPLHPRRAGAPPRGT